MQFKSLPAGIALELIVQDVFPLARRGQFAERFGITVSGDIRDRAIGEVVTRDRDGLPQVGGEPDSELDVQVFARGAHTTSLFSRLRQPQQGVAS